MSKTFPSGSSDTYESSKPCSSETLLFLARASLNGLNRCSSLPRQIFHQLLGKYSSILIINCTSEFEAWYRYDAITLFCACASVSMDKLLTGAHWHQKTMNFHNIRLKNCRTSNNAVPLRWLCFSKICGSPGCKTWTWAVLKPVIGTNFAYRHMNVLIFLWRPNVKPGTILLCISRSRAFRCAKLRLLLLSLNCAVESSSHWAGIASKDLHCTIAPCSGNCVLWQGGGSAMW